MSRRHIKSVQIVTIFNFFVVESEWDFGYANTLYESVVEGGRRR